MFTEIKRQSDRRLIETRGLLDFIKAGTPKPPTQEPINILISKGLFFVQLYGAYEYTVKTTVSKSIELINLKRPKLSECKALFLSLALNSQLDSIASVGDKKWEKRHALFNTLADNDHIQIPNDLFPTNGRNLRFRQLESIWKSFSIVEPVISRPELRGRISELVNNRNAVAHGNETASKIGSLNTIAELYVRYGEISEVCSYIIQTFEDYIKNEKYLLVK